MPYGFGYVLTKTTLPIAYSIYLRGTICLTVRFELGSFEDLQFIVWGFWLKVWGLGRFRVWGRGLSVKGGDLKV